jgi:hypothetical protein
MSHNVYNTVNGLNALLISPVHRQILYHVPSEEKE